MFRNKWFIKNKKKREIKEYVSMCVSIETTTLSQKGHPLPKNTNYLNKSIPTNF